MQGARDAIDAIDCTGYQEDLGAAFDAIGAVPADTSSADRGALLDRVEARAMALNYCVGTFGGGTVVGDPGADVYPTDPTSDDGTSATTSGTQVTEVPEGYADTGSW